MQQTGGAKYDRKSKKGSERMRMRREVRRRKLAKWWAAWGLKKNNKKEE